MMRLIRRFIRWIRSPKENKVSEKWLEKNTDYWWHRRDK